MTRGAHRAPSRAGRALTYLLLAVVGTVIVVGGLLALGYIALDKWDEFGASNTPGSACVTCPAPEKADTR